MLLKFSSSFKLNKYVLLLNSLQTPSANTTKHLHML